MRSNQGKSYNLLDTAMPAKLRQISKNLEKYKGETASR